MSDRAPTLRRQLLTAAGGTLGVRIAAILASMAAAIVLARALGPAAFGTYAYVFAISSLLAAPAQLGIPALVTRETARSHALGAWPEMRGLWRWANRSILSMSVALGACGLLYVILDREDGEPQRAWTFAAGFLLVPLIALSSARGAALAGLRFVARGQFPDGVMRPLLLVLFVGAAWLSGGNVSAPSAMGWHVLAAAISLVAGTVMLIRTRPRALPAAVAETSRVSEWWRAALPLAMITGLQALNEQTGLVVVGYYRPDEEAALYKVATSAAALTMLGMQVTALVAAPHIPRLHALGDRPRLQRLLALGALAGVGMTVPAILLLSIGGRPVITAVFGADYVGALPPLLILCVAQAANAAFGLNAVLLAMTGMEREAVRWLALAGGANVLFSLALVPRLGAAGSAYAQLASMLLWNIAFWAMARTKLDLDTSIAAAVPEVAQTLHLMGRRRS